MHGIPLESTVGLILIIFSLRGGTILSCSGTLPSMTASSQFKRARSQSGYQTYWYTTSKDIVITEIGYRRLLFTVCSVIEATIGID